MRGKVLTFALNMLKKILIGYLFLLFLCTTATAQVQVGAECTDEYLPLLAGKRVGLVVNHTSLVGHTHLVDTLRAMGVEVRMVFAPEHGFRGEAGNGDEVRDTVDARTGVAIKSLYGKHKKPTPADLNKLDIVVFDIQDVGTRFYTYISTLFYLLEACADAQKPVLVLDRPNPNGHFTDGPMLEAPYKSFVGLAPLPLVHGCTVGELALMFKKEQWVKDSFNTAVHVIPCAFYTHQTRYAPPVRPSPNLPDIRSILLYPSICLFEGTKVSVGRGTPAPFQRFGYPDFSDGNYTFTPTPNSGAPNPPHKGKQCNGFDLSEMPLDSLYALQRVDLSWLIRFFKKSPRKDDFFLSNGFFNLLAGNRTLRVQIEQDMTEEQIRASWQTELNKYRQIRQRYLLYPDTAPQNAQ